MSPYRCCLIIPKLGVYSKCIPETETKTQPHSMSFLTPPDRLISSLIDRLSGGFSDLSASKAIFRARTQVV